jgi:uncharacterized Zn-binding protein involved in type VI secretion
MTAKVMIGFMPAACMGDPHLCPAFDGPKPHVGGTILKGSLTVKIGNMPAARVGDPTECKGPPGTVAKGEMTVKIGDMGMGAAGGAGGGSEEDAGTGSVPGAAAVDTSAQIGSLKEAAATGMAFCQQCTQQPPSPEPKAPEQTEPATSQPAGSTTATGPSPSTGQPVFPAGPSPSAGPPGFPAGPPAPDLKKTFIAVSLIDKREKPLAKEPYEIVLPNGETRKGKLDAKGQVRLDGIDPGMCLISFPKLDELRRITRKTS